MKEGCWQDMKKNCCVDESFLTFTEREREQKLCVWQACTTTITIFYIIYIEENCLCQDAKRKCFMSVCEHRERTREILPQGYGNERGK